jgi:glucose/mannose-6-phosphate isomerase
VGYALLAIATLMGEQSVVADLQTLATKLTPTNSESDGKALAQLVRGHIPVIYASRARGALANNWKIRFNETAKMPAFCNIFPELNHNEMEGFDVAASAESATSASVAQFHFIFLSDRHDHPRIARRMILTKKLLEARGHSVSVVDIGDTDFWHDMFSALLLADWTALHLAQMNGVDPDDVPMIHELKQQLA